MAGQIVWDGEVVAQLRSAATLAGEAVDEQRAAVARAARNLTDEWRGDAAITYGAVIDAWQQAVAQALRALQHASQGIGLVQQTADAADRAHGEAYAKAAARLSA